MTPVTTLLCYGTLMRGGANHVRFCAEALTIEPAVIVGRLYHLPMGFPAMVETDDGKVFGEAMTFPDLDATLQEIDRLEGFRPDDPDGSLYRRVIRPVRLLRSGLTVPAYCYLWHRPVPHGAALIPGGRWRGPLSPR
jgi:gamma-glutamylcyclotransferase (GGCT)/AIG2-like uncharacterized protein YtfP